MKTNYYSPALVCAFLLLPALVDFPRPLLANPPSPLSAGLGPPDTTPPALVSVTADCALNKVTVVYSEPMNPATVLNVANYVIPGGITIQSAVLAADGKTVCLFTAPLTAGVAYTLSVANVTDLAILPNVISPNPTSKAFTCLSPCDLVAQNAVWKYLDDGSDQDTAWTAPAFNDSAWPQGPGVLGVENHPLVAPLIQTPLNLAPGNITFYFRTQFSWNANTVGAVLTASCLIDDGAVFYLNGVEAARVRVTDNPVLFNSLAQNQGSEGVVEIIPLSASSLVVGINVLAVELHQFSDTSSDAVFGLALEGCPCVSPAITTQPLNQTVPACGSVTFSVVASGTPPFGYQWFANGNLIADATGSSHTQTPVVLADDGTVFTVVITNACGSVTSASAVLHVVPDITPPTLMSAGADCANNKVTVVFSELMDVVTTADPFAYVLSDGFGPINIANAVLAADGVTICLFTDPLTVGMTYTLTVNGVTDLCENPAFGLTTNFLCSASCLTTCSSNKTVECGAAWNFDPPTNTCTNVTITVLNTVTTGLCPVLITREWSITDNSGSSNWCSQTVTVVDTTPPVMYCTEFGVPCGTPWAFSPPLAIDDCDGANVTVIALSTVTNGACPIFVARAWQATDGCGNSAICTQTVAIVDFTPPVLTCAGPKTVECSVGATGGGAPAYSVLKSFSNVGGDGRYPPSELIEGSDGSLYGTTRSGGANGVGTVFKLNKDGTGHTVIKSFSNTGGDGNGPEGGVVEASDGSLYGTTFLGGSTGRGTVYKLSKDGTGYTVLVSFVGSDGRYPNAGLVAASDGALYGTTQGGGSLSQGTIFKVNRDGTGFLSLKSLGGVDGQVANAGLIEASDGRLYGTTREGGSSGIGTVFKLNKNGTGYTVLKSFSGTDGEFADGRLVEGSDLALYGTTLTGGSSGFGTVFKLNKNGTGYLVLKNFSGGDGKLPVAGLTEGNDGALYGTTSSGGSSGLGIAFKVNKDGTSYTVLKSLLGPPAEGAYPSGALLRAGDGALYGTTQGGGSGGLGTVFKLQGNCTWSFDPPTATDACCGTDVTISVLSTVTNGLCPRVITRTWQATDCCHNSATCSQSVTINTLGTIRGQLWGERTPLNCLYNSGELPLPLWPVHAISASGSYSATTDSSGFYSMQVPAGTYTITAGPGTLSAICPPSATYNAVIVGCGKTVTKSFGFLTREGPDCPNLWVNLTATYPGTMRFHIRGPSTPCCGKEFFYHILYGNNGSLPVSGAAIAFHYPASPVGSIVSVVSSPNCPGVVPSPFVPNTPPACPPTHPSSGLETFTLPTLNPGAFCTIMVKVHLCCDITTSCPTQIPLYSRATIFSPSSTECKLADNISTHAVTPCCSSDPNDCTVSPKGCGPEGLIHRDQALTYLTQFQNQGGGAAALVVVRSVLDDDLDLATLEILGSSHDFVFESDGRELTWSFPNIGLASQSVDEEASHGFVKFRVLPRSDAAVGSVITNSAEITFDLNDSITTITTTNTITENPVPVAAFTIVPQPGSADALRHFVYTGGTPGAQLLWNFGPDAVPSTSTAVNPAGVLFTTPGSHLVGLEVRLGDCVAEPAVQIVTVGRPTLNITRTGTEATLSWARAGFLVEQTGSLTPPVQWQAIPAEPFVVDGFYYLNVPVPGGIKFYRLAEIP